nr:translation initiation factor IF-2-like [Anser cygnoides]
MISKKQGDRRTECKEQEQHFLFQTGYSLQKYYRRHPAAARHLAFPNEGPATSNSNQLQPPQPPGATSGCQQSCSTGSMEMCAVAAQHPRAGNSLPDFSGSEPGGVRLTEPPPRRGLLRGSTAPEAAAAARRGRRGDGPSRQTAGRRYGQLAAGSPGGTARPRVRGRVPTRAAAEGSAPPARYLRAPPPRARSRRRSLHNKAPERAGGPGGGGGGGGRGGGEGGGTPSRAERAALGSRAVAERAAGGAREHCTVRSMSLEQKSSDVLASVF